MGILDGWNIIRNDSLLDSIKLDLLEFETFRCHILLVFNLLNAYGNKKFDHSELFHLKFP